MKKEIILSLLNFLILSECQLRAKKAKKFIEPTVASKYDNPDQIRDRHKDEIKKPQMPANFTEKYNKPFNPAWMEYCNPNNCNDYHKIACGLNRVSMRFKWFQSTCHMILNNMCATYRGSLKYDIIENKFCTMYVMYLRASCPTSCEMESLDPICGISTIDNHAVLFKNQCSLDAANCRDPEKQEYEKVSMGVCKYYLTE